jgi:(1->4)-alpha-D-glucan 1-alpha-D-glucosylmutase
MTRSWPPSALDARRGRRSRPPGRRLRPGAPARAAGAPALPPGLVARGRGRHQLAPVLRHHRTGRTADRGSGRVRGRPRPALAALWRGPDRRLSASTMSMGWPIRPAYCRALRRRSGADPKRTPWLVVEKILGAGETLPGDWGVDGTTGYEVMNEISALQHDPAGAEPLARFWAEVSGRPAAFEARGARRAARDPDARFRRPAGRRGAGLPSAGARIDLYTRDLALPALAPRLDGADRRLQGLSHLRRRHRRRRRWDALAKAKAAEPASGAALDQIGRWLSGQAMPRRSARRGHPAFRAAERARRGQGGRGHRLLSLWPPASRNDVGFDPGRFSTTPAAFAALRPSAGEAFPSGLLATATHDHKRGEDVRARLAVLSQIPDLWIERAALARAQLRWTGVDPGDAYILHQMIVGAWPLDLAANDAEGLDGFADRLADWQRKALREAKLRTSWTVPDEPTRPPARPICERC